LVLLYEQCRGNKTAAWFASGGFLLSGRCFLRASIAVIDVRGHSPREFCTP